MVALVAAGLALGAFVVVTDVRGRAEASRAADALSTAHAHLDRVRAGLARDGTQLRASNAEVQSLDTTVSQDKASLGTTNAAIASTEEGLFFGGYDIAALGSCLGGVTQALDQAAVGQTSGALASLGSVAGSCGAAKQGGG